MEQEKFKCPQCGATNVEKIGINQYNCPYCGHHFYVQNDTVVEGDSISKYNELRTKREQRNQELVDAEDKKEQLSCVFYIIIAFLIIIFILIRMCSSS